MFVYSLVVMVILITSSAVLAYILKKNKLLDLRVFLALIISSLVVSLLFPVIFGALSSYEQFAKAERGIYLSLLIAFVIYITLIFLLSVAICILISDKKLAQITEKVRNIFNIFEKSVDTEEITDKMGLEVSSEKEDSAEMEDYFDEEMTDDVDVAETLKTDSINGENAYEAENMDSDMDLSLNECVDEAFRLKEQGDFEGAILYYMYALDKEPEKDLVFWIILDICVLYKSMGHVDLAREILESYVDKYGNVMNENVKSEIERNLLYI